MDSRARQPPMSLPMAHPMLPPLRAKPRLSPECRLPCGRPSPCSSGHGTGGGMCDMTEATMGMGGKLTFDPKTGFGIAATGRSTCSSTRSTEGTRHGALFTFAESDPEIVGVPSGRPLEEHEADIAWPQASLAITARPIISWIHPTGVAKTVDVIQRNERPSPAGRRHSRHPDNHLRPFLDATKDWEMTVSCFERCYYSPLFGHVHPYPRRPEPRQFWERECPSPPRKNRSPRSTRSRL